MRWRLDGDPTGTDAEAGPERAGLLDLSVSGARILARDCDDLTIGDITVVQIRSASGPVIVRRITPSSQPGFSTFGLEFADPTSRLPQLIHEELAQRASASGPAPDAT